MEDYDRRALGGLVGFFFVAWIVAVIALAFYELPNQSGLNNPAISPYFRAVLMGGYNLRYYMTRGEFENILYPNRPALIKEITAALGANRRVCFFYQAYISTTSNWRAAR